jgi:hypothetical protein
MSLHLALSKIRNVITIDFMKEQEELMQVLSFSSLYIVPINGDTGIKRKILDALSLGLLVMGMPHINPQMNSRDSLFVFREIEKMYDAILSMTKIHRDKCISLQRRTCLCFKKKYSPAVYEKYINIFQELW